jgi:hypothetical protein
MEEILDQYKNHQAPTPEGYFDSLPDQVMARIAAEDAQVSAMLEAHRNNKGYAVPEGYFENLPAAVSARMAAEGSHRPLVLRRRLLRIASVAACAGLLMGTGIYVFNMLQNPEELSGGKMAHVKGTPPVPVEDTQNTLDLDKALAYTDTPAEPAKKTQYTAKAQPVADPVTDQFITENLDENDLDEVDYDILDFYNDDIAINDMWGF